MFFELTNNKIEISSSDQAEFLDNLFRNYFCIELFVRVLLKKDIKGDYYQYISHLKSE